MGDSKAALDASSEKKNCRSAVELCQRLAERRDAWVEENGAGLDVTFKNLLEGVPNRARVKLFQPAGQRRLVVFFYKKSLLPHSRDRFAYGCCVARENEIQEADAESWLAFAASGFDVSRRPQGWMRGVPFGVPE